MRQLSLFLIALLFTLSTVSSINANEPSGNYWASGQATFHVGINGNSPTGGSWNDAFKRAMDEWSDETSFEFIAVDEYLDPCTNQGAEEFGDNVTGVDFTSTRCGVEYGNNVLAVTLTSGTCFSADDCDLGFQITDSDIVFNSNVNWDVYDGNVRNSISDFRRVALHELGHAIGLGHESTNTAIMQALVSDVYTLQADDINGANSIYGGELTNYPGIETVYGISVALPSESDLSGPSDTVNLSGQLDNTDATLDGKFIDIYQYTFLHDSSVEIQLESNNLDSFLYFVRVTSTQDVVPEATFTDDNSGTGNNASISKSIQAGTYWVAVTSANANEQGSYDVSLSSTDNSLNPSFEIVDSTYGPNVEINPNPNIVGALANSDFIYQGKFLDLYQFEVLNTTTVRVDLSSAEFDTNLILVDVLADNALGNIFLTNDDISGSNTNSRLEQSLLPGTYWIAVTSFASDETGDYNIDISVIIP